MSILGFATGVGNIRVTSLSDVRGNTNTSYMSTTAKESFGPVNPDIPNAVDFTASSSFWVSFYVYMRDAYSTSPLVKILNGENQALSIVRNDDETINIRLYTDNDGSTYDDVATSTRTISTGIRYRFDVEVILSNTTGVVSVYMDRALIVSYSGDTMRASSTNANNVLLYLQSDYSATYFSSVFISTEDSREITMVQSTLSGDGSFSDMSGSYTDVDELGSVDDSDFLYSDNPNEKSSFTKTDIPSEFNTGYQVIGVGVASRCYAIGSAANSGSVIITDGTNVIEGGGQTLTSEKIPITHVFETAPDGTAWDTAKANAAQIGVKSYQS